MERLQSFWPVVLILALTLILFASTRVQRRKFDQLNESPASPLRRRGGFALARARITDAKGVPGEGGKVLFHLEMMVEPMDGPKYPATTTWLVATDALHFVGVGQVLSVKVSVSDSSVIQPNGPWATWAPPGQ